MRSICAVIPAAGRGTRLGLACPKILAPLGKSTVWSLLRSKLTGIADHIAVVLSPAARPWLEQIHAPGREGDNLSICFQPRPIGMGDAIFRAAEIWRQYDSVMVLWGDQVNISRETLRLAASLQLERRSFVVPLAECVRPYVQYVLEGETLLSVRQSREGDRTDETGLSDAGLFVLATEDLEIEWSAWLAGGVLGSRTGEINFLPFLPWLSAGRGWRARTFRIENAAECRGVNTPADLEFASKLSEPEPPGNRQYVDKRWGCGRLPRCLYPLNGAGTGPKHYNP